MPPATHSHPDARFSTSTTLLFYAGLFGFVSLSIFFTPLIQLLAD